MDKNKKLERYKEMQELSQVSLVDVTKVLMQMVDAGAIDKKAKKLVVSRTMFEAAQRIVLKGGSPNSHEIEVNFNE